MTSYGPMSYFYLGGALDVCGFSWFGASSHGPMSEFYLRRAHDARGCSWTGCSPVGPWTIPTCAMHRMLVDGMLVPAQRTGCSWMVATRWPIFGSSLRGAPD
eukprot:6742839-Pyramimonas_sp.AAC.1